MKIRKTISLEEEDFDSLEFLLKKNDGNFSKAIRELIRNNSSKRDVISLKKPLSPNDLKEERKEIRNLLIEKKLFCSVPMDLLGYWLKLVAGMIPPLGYYRFLFDRIFPDFIGVEKVDIKTYSEYVNTYTYLTGSWGRQSITYDDPKNPTWVKIRIEMSRGQVEPIAALATYIVAHEPLRLKPVKVTRSPTFIDVDCVVAESEDEAYKGVVEHFGFNQDIYEGLQRDPDYWRGVFKMAKLYDNSLAIFGLQDFLKIQKGESHDSAILTIERILGSAITEVPLEKLLAAIEMIGRINGMIKKIDVDEEKIKIYFTFHDSNFAQRISCCTLNILENAGHKFTLKKVYEDWCIFTR
jgi:hypothetical protein